MLLKCCIFNFTFELFIIALWNKNWICTVPLPSVDLLNSLITMFLTFHTVHGVLRAKILKWFAIPFSRGPRFVRTLRHDPVALHRMAHSSVVATRSGKQTHSEGQCRWWSALYYTGGPKEESPLSQGPRPTFVITLHTLSVLLKPTSPNSLNPAWKVFKGDTVRL